MYIDFFFFQAEDGIRDAQESRGLGDVYKRQTQDRCEVVQLKATFFRGGFYDLNRFKFQFFKDKITKREILNLDVVDTEDVETTDYLSSEEQYFFEVIDTQRSP
eukprot:TRINITY_DN1230_c0_g1_i4.p2 TRINITY_DN1230_c0_g1~~TRINITY_DN1230_c0_g1_i4.p2  ORF type:complete len:104 (+),score=41.19 TRINITY_DN1230_c0_g1_i4:3-314(+)